jgi:hypothetical protein
MKVVGISDLSEEQVRHELSLGARFVVYQYCMSMIIITRREPSEAYFIRPNESAVAKGLKYSLLTCVVGWWGIPWGPIFTVQTLYRNFRGGIDVTEEIRKALDKESA